MLRNALRRWLGFHQLEARLDAAEEALGELQGLAEEPKRQLADWAEAYSQLNRILARFAARDQKDREKHQDDPMARARARVMELKQGGRP